MLWHDPLSLPVSSKATTERRYVRSVSLGVIVRALIRAKKGSLSMSSRPIVAGWLAAQVVGRASRLESSFKQNICIYAYNNICNLQR